MSYGILHGPQFGRHYWLGLKLLWGDIKTAKKILKRILRGFPMTRRERKQLLRTASDIFRMVPLAVSWVKYQHSRVKAVEHRWDCSRGEKSCPRMPVYVRPYDAAVLCVPSSLLPY